MERMVSVVRGDSRKRSGNEVCREWVLDVFIAPVAVGAGLVVALTAIADLPLLH